MTDERREHRRFAVNWRGRLALPNKELVEVSINDISKGGVAITFPYALSVGTPVSIEFYVRYRSNRERLRAKTRVAFNTILSDNRGAKLGLQFTAMSKEHTHMLSNVLHIMEDEAF